MLTPLAPDLWDHDAPLTVLGMSLGHRMTVVRLPDQSLWVHSPVAYSAELGAALARLGPVAHLVAPNCVHDTYLEGWFTAYPGARFHGARGFSRVRPDLKFTDTLGDAADPAWASVMDQHLLRGMPRVNEVVFCHRPSRTLIVTDLIFNLGPDMPWLSRVLLRINDCYCKAATSRLLRSAIADRGALKTSVERVLSWDFERVVLSHGRNLETAGKETIRDALAFL